MSCPQHQFPYWSFAEAKGASAPYLTCEKNSVHAMPRGH